MHMPLLAMIFLLLSACGGGAANTDINALLGSSTATGTIAATGSSLHRRGTHLLLMQGRNRFFLESRSVNLDEYINQYVVVEGEISVNAHPSFLPVMQVVSVIPVDGGSSLELQRFAVSALKLSLEAPREWNSEMKNGRLTFTHPDEDFPFIAIERGEKDLMPQEGIPIRIDAHNGVRIVDEETGVHSAYVKLSNDEVVLFTFGPKGQNSMQLRDAFYAMLKSVEFTESIEQIEDPENGAESGSRQPCGGPAGVLCPEGEYCEVTEFLTGIGTCHQLH